MRRAYKNKKGMTLMEVLVGSMLFGMVVVTVSAIISPMIMSYRRANDLAEYNMILDNVGNLLVSEMSQASDVLITGTGVELSFQSGAPKVIFNVVDGSLIKTFDTVTPQSTPAFPPGFYRGKSVEFEVTGVEPNFTILVTVRADGTTGPSSAAMQRAYAVRPLQLS